MDAKATKSETILGGGANVLEHECSRTVGHALCNNIAAPHRGTVS